MYRKTLSLPFHMDTLNWYIEQFIYRTILPEEVLRADWKALAKQGIEEHKEHQERWRQNNDGNLIPQWISVERDSIEGIACKIMHFGEQWKSHDWKGN